LPRISDLTEADTNGSSCLSNPEETDLYPYLLVNIGSGVSVIKVEGDGKYERISGSSLGGGTFWGLARLLTQRKDFDEILELSMQGDNANVRRSILCCFFFEPECISLSIARLNKHLTTNHLH